MENDNFFTQPVMDTPPGTVMKFHGKEQIIWSVNSYLGLAGNEEIKSVARDTLDEWSVSGPMGSRMMSGNTIHHIELEKQLAEFAQKEASILFNYGYLGVIGSIASILGPDDTIVMDKLAHACIIDSALMSRAQLRVYRHNDMESLENTLKRANKNRKGGVLILTEGVYGMTGDLAKLDEICALKEKYNARIFVDDAHGVGVVGDKGRGAADFFGVQDKVDLYFGTFAKAFASIGGFTAGDTDVIQWIRYNARTQIFAKSLPMIYVKSLEKTLELVINGDDRRKKCFENSRKLADGLRDLGYFIAKVDSPIVPVFLPEGEEMATTMMAYLRERGVFISAVVYPVIPRGLALIRMIPTAAHTDEQINTTIEKFKEMRDELKLHLNMDPKVVHRIYSGHDE
jgi:glycine C-acetyltransferase